VTILVNVKCTNFQIPCFIQVWSYFFMFIIIWEFGVSIVINYILMHCWSQNDLNSFHNLYSFPQSIFKTLNLLSFTFLIYYLRALNFSIGFFFIFKKKTKSLWKTWSYLCKKNLEPSSEGCVNSPHKLKCNNLFLWTVWWMLPCGMGHNRMYAIIIIKSSY
jgi:hypothetical protein